VVLIQALLNLKDTKLKNDLYFVFTTQEEVGIRGAKTSSYAIMPDYAIAVDVTGTGDTPEASPMVCKVGGGAAIKIMDSSVICHREMINLMMKTAEKNKIPYQSEILLAGGTDTANMQTAGAGSIAGAISIASRYIHSGVEMCDMKDVKACVDLLVETLKAII
jgi:endoglucanase